MAIPLRALDSPEHRQRASIDSETSAILSFALGTQPEDDDFPVSSVGSSIRNSEEEEEFLKEQDPLAEEYEPTYLQKKVIPVKERVDERNHGGRGLYLLVLEELSCQFGLVR